MAGMMPGANKLSWIEMDFEMDKCEYPIPEALQVYEVGYTWKSRTAGHGGYHKLPTRYWSVRGPLLVLDPAVHEFMFGPSRLHINLIRK